MVTATSTKILVSAVVVLCLWVLQSCAGALEFDRQQLLSGQLWRIWTGHFVHSNMPHLWLNIAAALLIYFGFFTQIKWAELLACGFVFPALISATLLGIYPELDWYNGLSGLLHALVAYFSISLIMAGNRVYWLGLGIVWLKVLAEATAGDPGATDLFGHMTIISEAHLTGAAIGTITAIISSQFKGTVVECPCHR